MSTVTAAPPLYDRIRKVNWSNYVVYIGFAVVFLFFAITQTQYFLNFTNLTNIAVQAAPIAVMAIGLVFVLSTGEIDLSIGSTVALSALSAAVVLQDTGQWWLGALAGLAVGAGVGLVNGIFITVVRLPSFLVTLATLGLVAGLARQLTDLQSVPSPTSSSAYRSSSSGRRPQPWSAGTCSASAGTARTSWPPATTSPRPESPASRPTASSSWSS